MGVPYDPPKGSPPNQPSSYAAQPSSAYPQPSGYQQHDYGSSDPVDYSVPPPSYSSEPLMGETRHSLDNVPDDFKWTTNVGDCDIMIRHAFVRKVYTILSVQLLATAAVSAISFFNDPFKTWIQTNVWMFWVSMLTTFAFLFGAMIYRKSYPMNMFALAGFTLGEAYTVAVATSFYDSRVVVQAAFITAGLFVALTMFAMQTRIDFSSWGTYLYGALWVVILLGFVQVFFPAQGAMQVAYSGGICLLFSAYVLYDTQQIMKTLHPDEEIAGAIGLYLDILNIFLA